MDNTVAWYRSDGGVPPTFTRYTIATFVVSAYYVITADVDGDGALDILTGSWDGRIMWFRNDGAVPPTFTTYNISTDATVGALSLAASDVNNDGLMDVVVAETTRVRLFLSTGGTPVNFTAVVVNTTTNTFVSVVTTDIGGLAFDALVAQVEFVSTPRRNLPPPQPQLCPSDMDGLIDIASASIYDGKIAWYKNGGGLTPVRKWREMRNGRRRLVLLVWRSPVAPVFAAPAPRTAVVDPKRCNLRSKPGVPSDERGASAAVCTARSAIQSTS